MRDRELLWPGILIGAVAATLISMVITKGVLSQRVYVTEWSDVSVPYQSETLRVPSRVEHAGVEYECTLVGSAPETVLFGEGACRSLKWGGEWWVPGSPIPDRGHDHTHDWSRTLNGVPVSGAECLDCGEVAE